jgi:hypothetical protein
MFEYPQAKTKTNSAVTAILAICFCGLGVLNTGCHDSSDDAADALNPVASAATQTSAEKLANVFIQDLQRQQFSDAAKMTDKSFTGHDPAKLADQAHTDYVLLLSTKKVEYEPATLMGKDKKVVLRAHFTDSGVTVYHTNFVFSGPDDHLLISQVFKPVKKPNAISSQSGMSSMGK